MLISHRRIDLHRSPLSHLNVAKTIPRQYRHWSVGPRSLSTSPSTLPAVLSPKTWVSKTWKGGCQFTKRRSSPSTLTSWAGPTDYLLMPADSRNWRSWNFRELRSVATLATGNFNGSQATPIFCLVPAFTRLDWCLEWWVAAWSIIGDIWRRSGSGIWPRLRSRGNHHWKRLKSPFLPFALYRIANTVHTLIGIGYTHGIAWISWVWKFSSTV